MSTHSQHIVLNSEDADTINAEGNFATFQLQQPLNLKHVTATLSVKSVTYTNLFYNVTPEHTSFYTTLGTYTISEGRYTLESLLTALNALGGLTFSFSEVALKITVTAATPFLVLDGANNMNRILGMEPTFVSATTIVSSKCVRLEGTTSIYLSLPNLTISSNAGRRSSLQRILTVIPNVVLIGELVSYNLSANYKYRLQDAYLSQIQVKLEGNNGELDFNGSPFFIHLYLETVDVSLNLGEPEPEPAEPKLKKDKK
jgi:hypothetical protein